MALFPFIVVVLLRASLLVVDYLSVALLNFGEIAREILDDYVTNISQIIFRYGSNIVWMVSADFIVFFDEILNLSSFCSIH